MLFMGAIVNRRLAARELLVEMVASGQWDIGIRFN
jgi:hypothetical protein